TIPAKAGSKSRLVAARTTCICSPRVRAASRTSNVRGSVFGSVGLTNRATVLVEGGITSRSNSRRFGQSAALIIVTPVAFPPRPVEAVNQPKLDWIACSREDNRSVRYCSAYLTYFYIKASREDYSHLAIHQLGRQRQQLIEPTFCPAIFNRDVTALDSQVRSGLGGTRLRAICR